MICKKCNTDNITKAGYCHNCGNAFTDDERKAAYDATVYGKLDKIEKVWKKIKSIANLSIITDNKYVKYGTLAVIILYGLMAGRAHGNSMTILESDEYHVQYNKTTHEYYVMTDYDNVTLNLYLPKQADSIYIEELYGDGSYCDSNMYSTEEAIVLQTSNESYYVVEADYSDSCESMTLYVVNGK